MNERSSIFEVDPLDISGFKPKVDRPAGPAPEEIDGVGQGKYRSREPVSQPSSKRPPMVYRTGRNVTFSVKTAPATADAFYELARRNGWKANETFERAIEALRRSLE